MYAASRRGPSRIGNDALKGCSLPLPLTLALPRLDESFWEPEIRDASAPRLLDEDGISNAGETFGTRCVPLEFVDIVVAEG